MHKFLAMSLLAVVAAFAVAVSSSLAGSACGGCPVTGAAKAAKAECSAEKKAACAENKTECSAEKKAECGAAEKTDAAAAEKTDA